MKAITIKQPWASLICNQRMYDFSKGIKDIENRTWPTKFRGRVLVHASSAKSQFNFSIEQHSKLNQLGLRRWYDKEQIKGAIIGSVEIVDCVINHSSIWAEKSEMFLKSDIAYKPTYNWVLANPIPFPEPIPAKGKLSFWDYPFILAEPEEEGGELFCHCQLPIKEENQVMSMGDGSFYCRYCNGKWYK